MSKTVIAEGRTTNEAIENGLRQLKVPKDHVQIKVLDNDDKRNFFSILAPRVVKVELTLKEEMDKKEPIKPRKEIIITPEEMQRAKENIEQFMQDFMKHLPEGVTYEIIANDKGIEINIKSKELGYLIGYRGETLYSLQTILASVASKGIEQRIRVLLDIEGYKSKREKTLEDLADKVAKTVIRNRKSVTLEPMQAYERKIIHSRLQENEKVETTSIGEEPRRRVVVSLKRK